MSATVFTIANQKGGVGKTSTAVNLGWLAARQGLRTLIWDLDPQGAASFYLRVKPKVKKPSLYRVLLLNDDFTPMEFVVEVLARFFQMNLEQATQVMLHVHQNGVGECGVYTYEVAETKVTQVMDHARKNQHPLQCVMEKK